VKRLLKIVPIYTNFCSSNLCGNEELFPLKKGGGATYLVDFALPPPPSSPPPPLPPLRMSPWCNCSTSFLICNPSCVFPPLPAVPFLGCPCVPCVCTRIRDSVRVNCFIVRTPVDTILLINSLFLFLFLTSLIRTSTCGRIVWLRPITLVFYHMLRHNMLYNSTFSLIRTSRCGRILWFSAMALVARSSITSAAFPASVV
jgi:hypothetical protein